PHGEISEADSRELLDFAIENRKRVKDQLRKMDETFEEVDFSYTIKSTGEIQEIETLEDLEFGSPKIPLTVKENEVNRQDVISNSSFKIELKEGQKFIRDNQSGISYDLLFGAYLIDATEVEVIDPYIRLPYQLRNFMEFAKLLSEKKDPEKEIKLHLITSNNEDYIENAKDAFSQIKYSLEGIGL